MTTANVVRRCLPFFLFMTIAIASTPTSAFAQQVQCQLGDTLTNCYERFFRPATTPDAVAADEKKKLQEIETGTDTAGLNLDSTVKNLLSLFTMSGLLGQGTEDKDAGTVVFDINLPVAAADNNVQLKAVLTTNPTLFEPLKATLPEDAREAQAAALEKEINSLDSAAFELTWNLKSERFGRSFEQHRNRFVAMAAQVVNDARGSFNQTALVRTGQLGQRICHEAANTAVDDDLFNARNEACGVFVDTTNTVVFSSISDPVIQALVMASVEDAARAVSAFELTVEQATKAAGLDLFASLVNNQPQLHFSGRYFARSDLVGPDQVTIKGTFELGSVNLNKLKGSSAVDCSALDRIFAGPGAVANLPACLNAYTSFVTDARNRARIKSGDRISVSVAYTNTHDYEYSSADTDLMLAIVGTQHWKASAGYGRLLSVADDGTAGGRFDFTADYENPFGDNKAVRNRRLVISAMITKNLGDFSIPFGVVYANKAEFLGDVDRQVSAHFGIKYNLFKES